MRVGELLAKFVEQRQRLTAFFADPWPRDTLDKLLGGARKSLWPMHSAQIPAIDAWAEDVTLKASPRGARASLVFEWSDRPSVSRTIRGQTCEEVLEAVSRG